MTERMQTKNKIQILTREANDREALGGMLVCFKAFSCQFSMGWDMKVSEAKELQCRAYIGYDHIHVGGSFEFVNCISSKCMMWKDLWQKKEWANIFAHLRKRAWMSRPPFPKSPSSWLRKISKNNLLLTVYSYKRSQEV